MKILSLNYLSVSEQEPARIDKIPPELWHFQGIGPSLRPIFWGAPIPGCLAFPPGDPVNYCKIDWVTTLDILQHPSWPLQIQGCKQCSSFHLQFRLMKRGSFFSELIYFITQIQLKCTMMHEIMQKMKTEEPESKEEPSLHPGFLIVLTIHLTYKRCLPIQYILEVLHHWFYNVSHAI